MQASCSYQRESDVCHDHTITKNSSPACCTHCIIKENVKFPVYITVMLFAMSTWIAITGLWVEMPLLVDILPESWSLPSHLIIIIQCANLGPALYAIVIRLQSGVKKNNDSPQHRLDVDVIIIFTILAVAIVAMLLTSFVWMVTVEVGGNIHSLPLFVLVCLLSLVSCTSSVIFLPYMARFKPGYISAYYIGQGLCGLVPGILGLAQGLGQDPECISSNATIYDDLSNYTIAVVNISHRPPKFSISIFFGVITLLLTLSCLAFYVLNFTAFCQVEMVAMKTADLNSKESACNDNPSITLTFNTGEAVEEKDAQQFQLLTSNSAQVCDREEETRNEWCLNQHKRPAILLTIMGLLNALTNGLLPATQSYTCLPYQRLTYMLSVRLSSVVSPMASLSTLFFPSASLLMICFFMVAATLLAVFHLILAGHSPERLITDLVTGQIVVIVTSILMMSSFSFVRVAVASKLRKDGGKNSLLWCGGVTQFGSFCGAIIAFILVKVLHVFRSLHHCAF